MPSYGIGEMIANMGRSEVTADVAARLVAEQFPQWAGMPVHPVGLNGWDNVTFRLGSELSVRFPSGDSYVEQVSKEHRWLPFLAARLPLLIPEPVALGRPGPGFPWPWSVYRWINGEPACDGPIADLAAFAADLAGFLAALYAIDAGGGPPPGVHSAFRGGPLSTWDEQTRKSIHLLRDSIDAQAATTVWDQALATTWQRKPVWVHGDVAPSNLLIADGTLLAVIDFGCTAVGDPACDLVMAWTFFSGEAAAVFRRGLPFDDATWARARGWALWKALVTITGEKQDGDDALTAARRFGWRHSPHEIIGLATADQRSIGSA